MNPMRSLLTLGLLVLITVASVAQSHKFAEGYVPVLDTQRDQRTFSFSELKKAKKILAISAKDTLEVIYCDFSILEAGEDKILQAFRVRSNYFEKDVLEYISLIHSARLILFENLKAKKKNGEVISIRPMQVRLRN